MADVKCTCNHAPDLHKSLYGCVAMVNPDWHEGDPVLPYCTCVAPRDAVYAKIKAALMGGPTHADEYVMLGMSDAERTRYMEAK